jgi:hypothetical protein
MTIYLAAGEDIDVGGTAANDPGSGGSFSVSTSTTNFRSAYCRCCLQTTSGGAASDPPTNRLGYGFSSAISQFWFHCQFQTNSASGGTLSNAQLFRFCDGTTSRLAVRGTGTNGQLKISKRTAAGTFTDLVTGTSGAFTSGVTAVDLFVNYAVSGQVTLYLNGVQVADYTGDVTTDSATTLSGFTFGGIQTAVQNGISEIIVSSSDTRGKALWTLTPQAAGNTQSWTPNTVTNINEVTLSDATFISTTANDSLSEWTTSTSIPSGSWSVDAIVQSARVEVAVSGPQHFDWVIRTADGTDNLAGDSNAPITSFGNFKNKIWATNPKTGTAWATSDITTGFNLGIKSLA